MVSFLDIGNKLLGENLDHRLLTVDVSAATAAITILWTSLDGEIF